MDAACPDSLEISGHCLAAARVIASLLVVPRNDGRREGKVRKTRKGGDSKNKLLDMTEIIIYICLSKNNQLWVKNRLIITLLKMRFRTIGGA